MPRLIFEASTIALTGAITYFVSFYIIDSKEYDGVINLLSSVSLKSGSLILFSAESYRAPVFQIFASSMTYPASLVSTVSSISGCQLVAGHKMPQYKSWLDVFKYHYETVSEILFYQLRRHLSKIMLVVNCRIN